MLDFFKEIIKRSTPRISLFFAIGRILLLVSIFVLVPLTYFLTKSLSNDYDKYDYKKISLNGRVKKAKLIRIYSRDNVSINGVNPKVVSYNYTLDGKEVSDNFQSLDNDGVESLKQLDSIQILTYNNQSLIKGIEPYQLSLNLFWLLPFLMFFGAIILIIAGYQKRA